MKKTFIPWYLTGLFFVVLFADRSRTMEEVSSVFGFVGMVLFIVANAYYPAHLIARKFRPLPKEVVIFFKKYLKVHVVLNLIAFFAVTIHWHYAEEGNFFLTGSFILTIFLTIEGIVMHYRMVPEMQKQLRLLHTQQTLFVVWILLIMIGHSVLE